MMKTNFSRFLALSAMAIATFVACKEEAKEEVAKVVENATNAWSGFWKNEYKDLNAAEDTVVENTVVEDEAATADLPSKSRVEEADSSDFN